VQQIEKLKREGLAIRAPRRRRQIFIGCAGWLKPLCFM
jgi:hypothetical protein